MVFCRDLLETNIEERGGRTIPFDPACAPRLLKVCVVYTSNDHKNGGGGGCGIKHSLAIQGGLYLNRVAGVGGGCTYVIHGRSRTSYGHKHPMCV